ncbi:MAG: HAMP domain-containing histidine kinase [Oscillospiraceae bacterium]|nr:HAMP domain-containing histidine kinase [Oscillospiraceae bacterium]
MNSLFARYYMWLATMLFLTILVMGIAFMTLANSYISGRLHDQAVETARNGAEAASAYMENFGALNELYKITINTIAQAQGSHILAADANGVVVMCSDGLLCREHVGRVMPEAFVQSVLTQGAQTEQSTLGGIYDAARKVAACAVTGSGGGWPIGIVTVSTAAAGTGINVGALLRICLFVAAAVLAASSVSAYLISKRLTKPLRDISRSTQRYARGDFSSRVPADSGANDEISRLCANFNAMADSLQHLEQLRREFIANVSHELRTPMTVIGGYVDGLLDGAIPRDDGGRYLAIVSEEVRRLSRLVARMLDITLLQSGQMSYSPRPVNLCELVRRVILGFENNIEAKGIDVACELPPDDINVLFDPDALTQVLTNLIDNAVKFTPPGGLLSISVGVKGHKGTVSVTNSGIDIPEPDLPFVFDRFHKADKSRGEDKSGLGLGLYIVRSIVLGHNETINASSANGLTTFTFSVTVTK